MAERKNTETEISKDNFIGAAIIGRDFNIISADEIVYSFLGTAQPVNLKDRVHPDDKAAFEERVSGCGDMPDVLLCRVKCYNGDYIELSMAMQKKETDGKTCVSIEMYDVIFLTRQYEIFIANNKIFNALISMSDKIFFRYETASGQMYVYNGRDTVFLGSMDEYRAMVKDKASVSEEDMPQFMGMCDEIEAANGEGSYKFDTSFFNSESDTGYYSTALSYSAIEFNAKVNYVVGMFASNTAGSAADSYISNRSNLDPLTNLLNKKAIKDYALEALAKAAKDKSVVTFLMIDLDNFKSINDTYGHMFGDETLVSVARVMNEAVGDRGVVGRIGGDEFFIVLTGFEDGNMAIRPLIRSIRSHVEWCFKNKLDDIKVTCSVGASTFPADAQNYDDMFKLADHCLYVAKSKGRDRFIIYTKDIHGSLEEIISNGTVIQMANFVSETDKSKHLLTVIQRFNSAKEYDSQQTVLKKVMLELLYYYDVDAVQYCPCSEDDAAYEVSNYKISDPRALISLYDIYKDEFKEKNYFTIGNYENVNETYPELYDYMTRSELYSLIIIPYSDDSGKLYGLFALSTRTRYQKWASFDINMLLVLCRLMERFIK